MRELAICPFCKKSLKNKLIANFYFCKECEIAIRNEYDMPLSGVVNIYDKDWVRHQESERTNFARASYVLKKLKRLNGIRTVLDVGCGIGVLVDSLNRSGYMADGVDSSSDAIEFAKSCRKGNFYLGTESLECIRGQYKYDLVVATQLIEHLRNPEIFLTNVKSHLNPMGYLYIESPNLYSWSRRSIWRNRIGGMFYGLDHRILYTSKSLIRLLRDNDFDIYRVITRTYSPTIFVEITQTFISAFRKKAQTQKELFATVTTNNKYIFKNLCKSVYKHLRNSFFINALLAIPNRISEINDRGNQLIVIAKNKA